MDTSKVAYRINADLESRPELKTVIAALIDGNATPRIVGGFVRDAFLRAFHGMTIPQGDIDIEVGSIAWDDMKRILSGFGEVGVNGAAYTILNIKLDGEYIDFSVPRAERKVKDTTKKKGRKAFEVIASPNMSAEDAALRRDFTCNAVAYDMRNQCFVDPFDGIKAIRDKKLIPVSDRFIEDPLRILRGMVRCARDGFALEKNSRNIKIIQAAGQRQQEMSKKRVWDEWNKWALAPYPSFGLQFLQDCGMLWWFPEIAAMQNVPQNPEWHPEGELWQHLKQTVDAAAMIARRDNLDETETARLVYTMLCHDMGKPETTVWKTSEKRGSYWAAPQHAPAGAKHAESFFQFTLDPKQPGLDPFFRSIVDLTIHHMDHTNIDDIKNEQGQKTAVLNMAKACRLDWLARVAEADYSGRNHQRVIRLVMPETMLKVLQIAEQLAVKQDEVVKPILRGTMLQSAGLKDGIQFGEIIRTSFAAQLNGEFVDVEGALKWLLLYIDEHRNDLIWK